LRRPASLARFPLASSSGFSRRLPPLRRQRPEIGSHPECDANGVGLASGSTRLRRPEHEHACQRLPERTCTATGKGTASIGWPGYFGARRRLSRQAIHRRSARTSFVPEADAQMTRRLDPRVIDGNEPALAGDLFERNRCSPIAARRHHDPEHAIGDKVRSGAAQPGRQQPAPPG